MSYAALLTQRGSIYRPTFDAPTGPEPAATWSDTPDYTGVPCRIQANQTKEQDKETGAVISDHTGFFLRGVDLLEKDRLVVNSVTYDVQGVDSDVAGASHHVQATLKVVR